MEELSTSVKEALSKMMKYCSYRDRCIKETREKLGELKLDETDKDKVIGLLLEHKFLDENRFASAFARGKFNQNKWGKIKISIELKRRGIASEVIDQAMEEIDMDDYDAVIEKLILQHTSGKKLNDFTQKSKTTKYLLQKGFETEQVRTVYQRLNDSFEL